MASILSPSAIHRIIILVENDDRPTGKPNARCGNCSLAPLSLRPRYPHVLPRVNSKWETIYKLYKDITPAPPLDYLDSLELSLVLKGEVDDADIRAIFAHGKPLEFWGAKNKGTHPLAAANEGECFQIGKYDGAGCRPWFSGAYWLVIGHVQRDLSYTDVRRFKIPSAAGAVIDCDLIRRYFNNSHMVDLRAPRQLPAAFPFTVKMLASLAARNFSVGSMELCVEAERLSDYRSMDVVFGELGMRSLSLTMAERRFVELVKTADFFRMKTVQGLRTLKLTLTQPWNEAKERRGRASSKSPLWVSGIYLLRNCQRYRVDYLAGRHMRCIERKIVQICQEFERGKITTTVEHFMFVTSSSKGMHYAFNRQNLLVSGLKVEGKSDRDAIHNYEWDVYRFRNTSTSDYLTACVGRSTSECYKSLLHISKGEVYPDESFACY